MPSLFPQLKFYVLDHCHGILLQRLSMALGVMQKAGVDRIKLAAKSDAAAQRLIDQGAAQRLVNIIEDSSDSGLNNNTHVPECLQCPVLEA